MVNSLSIDYQQFTFVDLGSGKGRTLLMASDYPFRRIVGVELLPELHRVAEENIRRYRSEKQECHRIESVCADAAEFVLPQEPLVVYLFNPFPESVLERVIENLQAGARKGQRPLYVLYHNPLLERALARSPLLKKMRATTSYVVYSARRVDVGR
jgi:hypothetical protein